MGRLLLGAIHGSFALEEVADGKAFKEVEHTFYARLADMDELLKASHKEYQEQWEIKVGKTAENAAKGSIRIRKTVKDGASEAEYVLTSKVQLNGAGDKIEVPVPTTVAMFESFKYLSDKGMIKDRYFFPVDGSDLVWEVDMFHKPEGGYYDWCKIDLEVKNRQDAVPPLPIEFRDIITNGNGQRTPEEEARVTALYSQEFLTKNQKVSTGI
jgi:hypothetical protein